MNPRLVANIDARTIKLSHITLARVLFLSTPHIIFRSFSE
jgi:hypothetical protein